MVPMRSSTAAYLPRRCLSFALLALCFYGSSTTPCASAADIGTPHSSVIDLTSDNFDAHLSDPANGLWFLKFYAPWCGHCKQLAPTLDKVAPFLSGKMAFGKIDCTTHKSLCNRFDVKGYPTLKIFRDGDYFMYPGKRDADSIIDFAERMAASELTLVSSYEEALSKVADRGDDGVGFVAYDPDASGATLEDMAHSTTYMQVFQQVARKLQAEATFGLLSPDTSKSELAKFGVPATGSSGGKFIIKLERDVDGNFFNPPNGVNSMDLMKYIRQHNFALVTELGPHNFRSMGDRQTPIAIAVLNPDDEAKSNALVADLRQFAKNGQAAIRYRYLYAKMDGKKWAKFLSQFSVEQDNIPELFVLDIANKKYFENSTIVGVEKFLTAVSKGEIQERDQQGGGKGPMEKIGQAFVKYMPWSLCAVVALIFLSFYLVLPGSEDLKAATSAAVAATGTTDTEGEKDNSKEGIGESKKDK